MSSHKLTGTSRLASLTCGEGHLILVEGVHHEDGDVEEHDGGLVPEHGRGGLVVRDVVMRLRQRHDVLQPQHWLALPPALA